MDEYYNLDNFDQEKMKENCIDLQGIFRQPTPNAFTSWVRKTMDCEESMIKQNASSFECYGFLFGSIAHAYHVILADNKGLEEESKRIKCIAETCWKLNEGLDLLVGEPIISIIPDEDDEDEFARKLRVLDRARIMFKHVLVEAFEELITIWDRIFIISWARKMYYHFHEFPTPYRCENKHHSLKIADHFIDLMKEVINIVPDGI